MVHGCARVLHAGSSLEGDCGQPADRSHDPRRLSPATPGRNVASLDSTGGEVDLAGKGSLRHPGRKRERDGFVCVTEVSLHDVTGQTWVGSPRGDRLLWSHVLCLENAHSGRAISVV